MGKKRVVRGRRIRTPKKIGGILPLLLPLIASLGAMGSTLGLINRRKTGKGLRRRKTTSRRRKTRRGRGLQLYPWSPQTPWLMSEESKKKYPY
jgi:hypothetical protein